MKVSLLNIYWKDQVLLWRIGNTAGEGMDFSEGGQGWTPTGKTNQSINDSHAYLFRRRLQDDRDGGRIAEF